MRSLLIIVITLSLAGAGLAQEYSYRLLNYNILQYSTTSDSRNDEFMMILDEIQPDLILAQEVSNTSGANDFIDEVLDPAVWSRSNAPGVGTSEEYVFYRHDLFELIAHVSIPTDLRNHELYTFRALEIPGQPTILLGDTHLKASQGEEDRRYAEVMDLVDYMDDNSLQNTDFIFAGDLNLYTSSEPAYQALLNDAEFQDPINTPGNWHDNAGLAAVHTQSPRTDGGGATGGMDDRFDFILAQPVLFDEMGWDVLSDTYTAFGNDGNHFNQAINDGTNGVVSPAMADAIHDASDHIPVYVDLGYYLPGGPLLLVLEPAAENQTIFPGGGIINFTAHITNTTNQAITYDGWTGVILPNGNPYGPLLRARNLHIAPNMTITRDLSQEIPPTAPGGEYTFVANVGNFPDLVVSTDQFIFTKLGGQGNLAAFMNWLDDQPVETTSFASPSVPETFELTRVYPNPFNSSSTVEFSLPRQDHVNVTVHDITGRIVATLADQTYSAGSHQLTLDLNGHASGIYFVTAQAGEQSRTMKAMLVR